MDLQIRIEDGAVDDYVALADHLNRSRDFRGRIRQKLGPPADGTLDAGVIEMLTVAVGSAGLGVALTNSLNTWLSTRRRNISVKVTVTTEGRTVELIAGNPNTRELELLGKILRDADGR